MVEVPPLAVLKPCPPLNVIVPVPLIVTEHAPTLKPFQTPPTVWSEFIVTVKGAVEPVAPTAKSAALPLP